MNAKPFVLLLTILLIVLVSGCIGQKQELPVGTNGLVITDFHTEPPEDQLEAGQNFQIFLEMENTGGTKATNVIARIYGLSWLTSIPAGLISWNTLWPTTPLQLGWFTQLNALGWYEKEIMPPDPITKSPGGIKSVVWTLPTPINIPEGATVSYPIRTRVEYDYRTTASATLYGYSYARYVRDLQRGVTTPVLTRAQIPVDHAINPTPIIISIVGPDKMVIPNRPYEEFVYHITFTNVGDGVPLGCYGGEYLNYPYASCEDGLIYGAIWIEGPGVYFKDCFGIGPNYPYWSTFGNIYGSAWSRIYGNVPYNILYPTVIDFFYFRNYASLIKLRRGQSVTKSCTIAVYNLGGWENRDVDTVKIYFDLFYRYYIEKESVIKVTSPIYKVP